jgi:hypothetical protein
LESFIHPLYPRFQARGYAVICSPEVAEITIHETTDASGAPVRTCLSHEDGALALTVGTEVLPLPQGALEAVMARYGKPLDAPEGEMMIDERLELGEGGALVRFRFMRRYDVIARDYLVLYRADGEPLCEMATSITAALDHLARRFASLTPSPYSR